MSGILLIVLGLMLGALAILAWRGLWWGFRFTGDRLIICPETHAPAAVRVDAFASGLSAAMGEPSLQLRECSRWAERGQCGQPCLWQIELAPQECLVRHIVDHWYSGKACAICQHVFHQQHWHDHPPALLTPEGKTVLWTDVPLPELPHILQTHAPLCWNCHIVQSFRREHADLVVHRPER